MVALGGLGAKAQVSTVPVEGLREASPRVHAITGARIVVAPGQVIEGGTLVLRDGVIAAVGAPAEVKVPADARLWAVPGKTLYAGLIEPLSEAHLAAGLKAEVPTAGGGRGAGAAAPAPAEAANADEAARSWNPKVTPERSVVRGLVADEKGDAKWRELGFTAAHVVPGRGVFRGQSALVTLNGRAPAALIVRGNVAQAVAFELSSFRESAYPSSLMGAIALIRQALNDARWQAAAGKLYAEKQFSGLQRPEANASLTALAAVVDGKQPALFEAKDELDLLRIEAIVEEFKLRAVVRGTGTEYRVAEVLAVKKTPLILPLTFPAAPEVDTPDKAVDVPLSTLQHWELAPANAAKLSARGIPLAFTASGLKKPEEQFWTNLRLAVKRGLAPDAALAAVTLAPAQMLGLDDVIGTLAVGKIANVIIASGDLFAADSTAEILGGWVDGDPFETEIAQRADVRGNWTVKWSGATGPGVLKIEGRTATKPKAKLGDKDAPLVVSRSEVMLLPPAELFGGKEGTVRLAGTVTADGLVGTGLLPDGMAFRWTAVRDATNEAAAEKKADKAVEKFFATADAYPAGAFGRRGLPTQPEWLLVKNATVWTSGPAGKIEGGDVLVHAGKIEQVGRALKAPAGAVVIDATGKHVSPGLIDAHSHTAIARGVNEGTSSVTVEVRVGDVLDATDIAMYRQLAGGLTASNLLHGSANAMGGQNQVIKLRWGGLPSQLKFAGAKPGVKFALGENVKQANWGERFVTRYPQTRMGVEQVMLDTFAQARDYERAWAEWKAGEQAYPPRVNLRLEAALEILRGDRVVHIHSYRQDEVLMFIRLAQKTGITVATFQHILEGYKVADQIAALGAGASCFTDWWAYKFEVVDAIPHAGAMMHDAGVVVSFNSDDNGLARRLNTEAAKAMKYGNVPAEEALKFVTLNPAKQLLIADRVGSLEPGKDADLVIWSASPLSTYARCEQTWIDGRRYFDLGEDAAMRAAAQTEREALVQKALAERVKALAGPPGGGDKPPGEAKPVAPAAAKPAVTLLLEEMAARHAMQYRELYHNGSDSLNCSTHALK